MLSFAGTEPGSMGASEILSVPGTSAGVAQAAEAVKAWSDRQGLAPGTLERLLTVLDELLSNVVRHGLHGQSGTIDVRARCEGGLLEIQVADDAPPFNPLLLPPPDTTAPLDRRQPGGLGIALVRALTDDVRYERAGNRNQLTVTWQLDSNPT